MERNTMTKRTKSLFGLCLAALLLGSVLVGGALAGDEDADAKDAAQKSYLEAHRYLNKGKYERAATEFGDIYDVYRDSALASEARYWQAYSMYQLGDQKHLKSALENLNGLALRDLGLELQGQSQELETRILAELTRQGDMGSRRAPFRPPDRPRHRFQHRVPGRRREGRLPRAR